MSSIDERTVNDQPFINYLPSMAVAAWYYHKAPGDRRTVAEVFENARRFAQGEYATALQLGSGLPAARRALLARKLAAMIGLPEKAIYDANLRIGSETFLDTLLRKQGKLVGRLDLRVSGPTPPPPPKGVPAAINDPSFGIDKSLVVKSADMADYLRNELKAPATGDYLALTLKVNFAWDYRGAEGGMDPVFYFNATPNIAALIKARPAARVLEISGYYDLAIPPLSARYALSHAGIPAGHVTTALLPGPHTVYEDPKAHAAVLKLLGDFVAGRPVSDGR
jgi:carboxypeptidase C (cathepsin A)